MALAVEAVAKHNGVDHVGEDLVRHLKNIL